MLLAVVLTAITLAVLAAVLVPLLRKPRATLERAQFDRAVYSDQIKELERDAARGLLPASEAEAARLEIQRRLLAAAGDDAPAPTPGGGGRWVAAAIGGLILAGSAGLYLYLGTPSIPAIAQGTHAQQQAGTNADERAHQDQDMAKQLDALEAKLQSDPNNQAGWVLLARSAASLNQWERSARAYKHAAELAPNQPALLAEYGETEVMVAAGIVTPAAHDAFAATVALDPKNTIARFYLALADAQAGEPKRAIDTWLSLAGDAPAGSPLREEIERRIGEQAKIAGIPLPTLPPPAPAEPQQQDADGPDDAAMAAAAQMPPEQRDAMIRGMVDKLQAKLAQAPDDADGWVRLGRSYLVLGDAAKSADAYDRAEKLRPGDLDIPMQEVEAIVSAQPPTDPIPPRAVALLHKVEAAQPDRVEVLWYLGGVAIQEGRKDDAIRYWERLLPMLQDGSADRKAVQGALDEIRRK
jgi:cytochrome c-type biogenesis protein CcmH